MEKLEVQCLCGARYRVKTSQDVKKIRCGTCKRSMIINVPVVIEKRGRELQRTSRTKPNRDSAPTFDLQDVLTQNRKHPTASSPPETPQQVDVVYDTRDAKSFPDVVTREWESQLDRHVRGVSGIRKVSLKFTVLKSSDFARISQVRARVSGTIDGARIYETRKGGEMPWYVILVGIVPMMILHAMNGPNVDGIREAARSCTGRLIVDVLNKSRLNKTKFQERVLAMWQFRFWGIILAPIPAVLIVLLRRRFLVENDLITVLTVCGLVGVMASGLARVGVALFGAFALPDDFLKRDAYGRAEVRILAWCKTPSTYRTFAILGVPAAILMMLFFYYIAFSPPHAGRAGKVPAEARGQDKAKKVMMIPRRETHHSHRGFSHVG